MNRRSIAAAYIPPVALMLIAALASWLMGDTGEAMLYKILFAPVFLLATQGLRSYFPEGLDNTRSLGTHLEFHFLDAALLGAFITAMMSSTDGKITPEIWNFIFLTLSIGSVNSFISWRKRERQTDVQ